MLYENIITVDEALKKIITGTTYYTIEDIDRKAYFAKREDVIFHPGGMIEVKPTVGAQLLRRGVIEHFWVPAKVDSPGKGGIFVAPVKILFQCGVQNLNVHSAEEIRKMMRIFKDALIK